MKELFVTVLIIIILILVLTSCSDIKVITHQGYFGPTTYELTDNDSLVLYYYNGDCCCIAKKVLQEVKNRVDNDASGLLLKKLKTDKQWTEQYLDSVCTKLKGWVKTR